MKLKHYLIASPENNYQPWILSKTALVCFCLSIWWLRMFMPGYINVTTGAGGIDPQDLMARINVERTNRLLPALITNPKLTSAANIKSQDMIDRDYFAHINPDGDYIWPVIESQGYKPYRALGENLAIDFSTPEALVNAWMNSPGHRANIVNDKFEDQGMAAVLGEYENRESYLVTNLFGALFKQPTPSTPSPTPTPAVSEAQSTGTPPNNQPSTPAPTAEPVKEQDTPTTSPTPTPSGNKSINNDTEETDAPAPVGTTDNNSPTPLTNTTAGSENLTSLKIVIGILAGLYTIFLVIDSIIIHRSGVKRLSAASSPHALAMLMISLVNFITLWI